MDIIFLGSGGPLVTSKRACSSILLDGHILFDVGCGSLRNLRKNNVNLARLEKVFLSHFHVDHWADLVPLIWAVDLEDARGELEIIGPKGVGRLVTHLMRLSHLPDHARNTKLVFREIKGLQGKDPVSFHRTIHKPTNYAYMIEIDSKSICYTGDTAFYPAIGRFASGCDLLVHEGLFTEDKKDIAQTTLHSTAKDAATIASMAEPRKLILSHLYPGDRNHELTSLAEARASFDGKVLVARDNLRVNI